MPHKNVSFSSSIQRIFFSGLLKCFWQIFYEFITQWCSPWLPSIKLTLAQTVTDGVGPLYPDLGVYFVWSFWRFHCCFSFPLLYQCVKFGSIFYLPLCGYINEGWLETYGICICSAILKWACSSLVVQCSLRISFLSSTC